MRPDRYKLANEWIYGEATPMEEAKATWEAMDAEFNENRRMQLADGGRIPFKYAGPVKFENIIKPKIYEGNRFSKKLPKGTFTMRLYMGLDENGNRIEKTFVGTKKQLKKIFDKYNKARVKGELPTMGDSEVYEVRQGKNKGKFAIRMPKEDKYSFYDTKELAEQHKEDYLNDPKNKIGGDTTLELESKKYPKGYLTKKQFLKFLEDNGITGKNAASFANNFGIKTKVNPYNKNLLIYDTSAFTPEKIDEIQQAQVKAGSGSAEAKKKFPIKTKYETTIPRMEAIEEREGVKKSSSSPLKIKDARKINTDLGHASNIYSPFKDELITLDNMIYTPQEINELMGKPGQIEDKINAIQESQYKIINDKTLDVDVKKELLEKSDGTLIRLASQSQGYKKVRLSDGRTFGGDKTGVDFMDQYTGMTEKDFKTYRSKYLTLDGNIKPEFLEEGKKKMKVNLRDTKNFKNIIKADISDVDANNLIELKIFEENRASSIKAASKVSKKDKSKALKNILMDFEKYGCNQAAGGRILFADGSPFGKVTKCADKGIARFLNDIKTGNYTEATKKLFRGGANLIKGVLSPMELLKLRNYFGPAALGFMAAFEAGVIADDVFRMGQPLNESLASNWLTKSFTPYSLRHAEISNLIKNNQLPSNMLQYAKDAVKFEEAKKEMERIENLQGTRVIDGSGYGFIDGTSMYTQEQEAKDVKGLTEKLSSIKDGSVIIPGSAKEMELQKLLTEKSATEMAKPKSINIFGKNFQYSDGFSPIFGFDKLKDVRTPKYTGYDYMPDETPKDLRPITYLDALDYKDQPLPAAERIKYENFFSSPEGGNYLKPRQSLSELKYKDTNILDELTKDYNQAQRIKLASELPGFYGTQDDREFMEGGIASLDVKKQK